MSTAFDEPRRSTPTEADSPDVRFGIADFAAAIRAEAHRREGTLQALLHAGLIDAKSANATALRRDVACFDAAALFLERLQPFIPDFRAYLRGRRFSQGRRG